MKQYYYHSPFVETIIQQQTYTKTKDPEKGVFKLNRYKIKEFPCKMPRITLMAVHDQEKETLTFTISRCSKEDTFVRQIGRRICNEKYKAGKILVDLAIPTEQMGTPGKYFHNMCKQLEEKYLKRL